MVWERLDPERIVLDMPAENPEDVFREVGGALVKGGYCRDSFVEALARREAENPTGIDMNGFGIAIPHTDISHVVRDGLAIGVLREPVRFVAMGTDDEFVDVRIVVALAITDPNGHIDQMKALLKVLQDRSVLEEMEAAKSAEQVIEAIRKKESAK